MDRLIYGTQGQVSFNDYHEFYFAMGFLANEKNAELKWEHNEEQGAWGSEGRIHCLVPQDYFPQFFRFTAGVGSVYARINCNDYVSMLVTEHNFSVNGHSQDIDAIADTIPADYIKDFWDGYNS